MTSLVVPTARPDAGSRERWIDRLTVAALLVIIVASCSTYRSMSVEEKRALLVELEETTLDDLVEQRPDTEDEIEDALGYAIFSNRITKIPVVGAGEGIGVVVDRSSGKRTYLKLGRVDLGGGLGSRTYRLIMLFFDQEALEKFEGGKLEIGAGVQASSGTEETGTGTASGAGKEEYAVYELSESGASATWTVNVSRYTVLDLGE